ncbi:MAG: cytochrome c oxidase subunit II [Balneolaceae bacterium]
MLPPARSTYAAEVDALFNFVNVISLILLLGITIAIIYFSIKYRRRSEDDTTPLITHDSRLEITWAVIPLILVLITFAWGFNTYLTTTTVPDDAYEVRVTATSWRWDFQYEEGQTSVNELHVPAGRPVRLVMISNDVIHSFYVPDLRIKMDVLPNRYSQVWFEATEPFESQIYCAEYCGAAHSNMLADIIVHSQEDFNTWLEEGDTIDESLTPAELGQQLVDRQGCLACHSTDGSRLQGPSFQGVFGRERPLEDGTTVTADENYIRQSLLEPMSQVADGYPAIMPPYTSLSDREIDSIIEYLKTLE